MSREYSTHVKLTNRGLNEKCKKTNNGNAVIKEEKQIAKKLVVKVKELALKNKWKIVRFAANGVYRNWDIIEPQLVMWMEVVRSLF
jgi:hypothetical protein